MTQVQNAYPAIFRYLCPPNRSKFHSIAAHCLGDLKQFSDHNFDHFKKEMLTNLFKEARPLLFHAAASQLIVGSANHQENILERNYWPEISLPFPVCAFEVLGEQIVAVTKTPLSGTDATCYTALIIAQELGPQEIAYLAFSFAPEDPLGMVMSEFVENGGQSSDSRPGHMFPLSWTIKAYLDEMRSAGVATQSISERIKARPPGGGKVFLRFKQLVHIRPRIDESFRGIPGGGQVSWGHRWEVMGHWRRVPGVGKDRQGQYGVQGATWVVPHVKGPESMPVVKKTRVIDQISP